MATKKKSDPNITDTLALDQINELLHNPKKLAWLNFSTGFIRGFAGLFGVITAVSLIALLVYLFGGLPYIGDLLHKIYAAAQA